MHLNQQKTFKNSSSSSSKSGIDVFRFSERFLKKRKFFSCHWFWQFAVLVVHAMSLDYFRSYTTCRNKKTDKVRKLEDTSSLASNTHTHTHTHTYTHKHIFFLSFPRKKAAKNRYQKSPWKSSVVSTFTYPLITINALEN